MRNSYQKKCAKQSAALIFRAFILCLATLITALVQCNPAAAATWSNRYYTSDNVPVEFNDVISVSGGGHLAVGRAMDSGISGTTYNAFIVRVDQNGQVLWTKNFTFPGRWYDLLHSVVESSDGGFIATGRVLLDGTTEHGAPSVVSAILILKVDANGNLLWDKLIKNYANNMIYGARIKATVDGHFVIVGAATAYQFNEQNQVYTYVAGGALITKIDTNGNVIFSNTHYGDWTHSWHWSFNDVVQDTDGSYYAIGYAGTAAYSEGIGGGGMLLAKINSAGSMVWAKKIDYAQDGEAVFVNDYGQRILISGNTLYVAGATYTSHLSSFTLSGARNWTKQYACIRRWDTGLSGASDFIHSGDGNFFVAFSGQCNNITKINSSGAILWSKDAFLAPTALALEADKGLIVGGWSDKSGTARGGVISKYDSNGNSCNDIGDIILTVGDIEMFTNAVTYNVWSRSAASEELPDFSGPALTVEKECYSVSDIKANGSDGPINIASTDNLSITIELSPDEFAGDDADWWLIAATPLGLFHYQPESNSWAPDLTYSHQGPLFNLGEFEVLNIFGLLAGSYTLYFGVDMDMNGVLDIDKAYYDSVTVNIQ